MWKLLKVREPVYGQSFSVIHDSYAGGFPQREEQLYGRLPGWHTTWCSVGDIGPPSKFEEASVRLKKAIREVDPDLILADNPLVFELLHSDAYERVVFDLCDWYHEYHFREFHDLEAARRVETAVVKAVSKSSAVIAQSPVILDWALARSGRQSARTSVVPNGFDQDLFYPGLPVRKNQKPVIVFAGRLGAWYGELLNVAAALDHGYEFIIAGDGPLRNSLQKFEHVECLGRLHPNDVAELVRRADACVMPVNDCSPIATSEYLACAKPVIHLGDRIGWLLRHGENGFLVNPKDPDWLAAIRLAVDAGEGIREAALRTPVSWQALRIKVATLLTGWR